MAGGVVEAHATVLNELSKHLRKRVAQKDNW